MAEKNLILFFAGVLTWPMSEYVLHRFLGHEWNLKTLFRREHQAHHAVKDFFAPAHFKLIAAVAVVLVMVLFRAPISYALGFVFMYLTYEWTHYSFHRFAPRTSWGLTMRKHHFAHHFMNAKKNFGVTTTSFDLIGKTVMKTERVKVPKTFAMVWLVDQDGQVKEEFRNDFFI